MTRGREVFCHRRLLRRPCRDARPRAPRRGVDGRLLGTWRQCDVALAPRSAVPGRRSPSCTSRPRRGPLTCTLPGARRFEMPLHSSNLIDVFSRFGDREVLTPATAAPAHAITAHSCFIAARTHARRAPRTAQPTPTVVSIERCNVPTPTETDSASWRSRSPKSGSSGSASAARRASRGSGTTSLGSYQFGSPSGSGGVGAED